jgi:hypothetical protein
MGLSLSLLSLAFVVVAGDRPPSPGEQAAFLAAARKAALSYADSLPDFLCTQIIERSVNLGPGWGRSETFRVELSFSSGRESYRLLDRHGLPREDNQELFGGSVGRGEFGSNLRRVFAPSAGVEYEFRRWTSLLGRDAAVYSYRVPKGDQVYELGFWDPERNVFLRQVVGLRGEVTLDLATHAVLKVSYLANEIPSGFPMSQAATTVDYDTVEIGGRRYLLPVKALLEVHARHSRSRNRITFESYRKFSSDTSIRFGTAR